MITKSEPTLILYTFLTALNGVQWPVIHMPTWAHIVVTGVSGAITAIINRERVSPW